MITKVVKFFAKKEKQPSKSQRLGHLIDLGAIKDLTKGGPDGQYGDGSAGTNPRRFKK